MNEYYEHLFQDLTRKKASAISQEGKSDIEPYDYVASVEIWYQQLFELITKIPPKYYVKSVDITQYYAQDIMNIKYEYLLNDSTIEPVSLRIHWV